MRTVTFQIRIARSIVTATLVVVSICVVLAVLALLVDGRGIFQRLRAPFACPTYEEICAKYSDPVKRSLAWKDRAFPSEVLYYELDPNLPIVSVIWYGIGPTDVYSVNTSQAGVDNGIGMICAWVSEQGTGRGRLFVFNHELLAKVMGPNGQLPLSGP